MSQVLLLVFADLHEVHVTKVERRVDLNTEDALIAADLARRQEDQAAPAGHGP